MLRPLLCGCACCRSCWIVGRNIHRRGGCTGSLLGCWDACRKRCQARQIGSGSGGVGRRGGGESRLRPAAAAWRASCRCQGRRALGASRQALARVLQLPSNWAAAGSAAPAALLAAICCTLATLVAERAAVPAVSAACNTRTTVGAALPAAAGAAAGSGAAAAAPVAPCIQATSWVALWWAGAARLRLLLGQQHVKPRGSPQFCRWGRCQVT